MNKGTGVIVSEEEVAINLGFADVFEMRRWETEAGQKLWACEQKLRATESDRDSFLWHGHRMQAVLEKAATFLNQLPDQSEAVADLRLAIDVVNGRAVDWHDRLKNWFPCPAANDPTPAQPAKED